MGMMLSLAVVTIVAEIKSNREFKMSERGEGTSHHSPVHKSLGKIEMPSILFFLGILMAVAALESIGMIFQAGEIVRAIIPDDVFVVLLGFGSAIIDNVPLVAASMGMFALETDHYIWHFIAFSAGTGGSMLIIGSAAGVVAMGMEKIDFMWYLKNIAWLAAIGFLSGCGVFMVMIHIFGL
jgi:Na+/H+ antiporter NhaD/arsenite permease-like protein